MTIQSIQADYDNTTVAYNRKAISVRESYRQIFEQQLMEQAEVIRNGSTETAIPLGGAAFTSEEWEKMLTNFDITMNDLREQMRTEHARAYEEQLQKIVIKEDYTDFSTSKYDVIADDVEGCFEVYNGNGDRVGSFDYSDMEIKVDAATGTPILISEHGTAAYDAIILDQELLLGFQEAMGVGALKQSTLEGFTLNKHFETGIKYLVKAGDEGRGGRLLIQSEEELVAIERLAETYMSDYPNLVSSKEVAQINAVLEVIGLMERTPNGIVSVNRDGMSYNDEVDPERNWALLFEDECYEAVMEFVRLNRIIGTDISEYDLWGNFFDENHLNIERIWSDQELRQGYLNQN